MMRNKDDGIGKALVGLALCSAITGGLMNMFFGNKQTGKKDVVKGVIDMLCDEYEHKIEKLENENLKLYSQKEDLMKEVEKLKENKPKKK